VPCHSTWRHYLPFLPIIIVAIWAILHWNWNVRTFCPGERHSPNWAKISTLYIHMYSKAVKVNECFVWVASHPISLSFCQTIGYRQARRINWKFKHIDQHKYVDKVQVQSAAWLLLAKLLFVNVRGGIWPTGCYFVHIYGSFGYLGITGLNVCSSLLKYRFYVAERRFLLTDGCYLTECNELWKDFVEKVL